MPKTKQLKSPETTGRNRDKNGKFIKGVSGNPEGRPPNTKNFSTLMDEAVKQIAEVNNITEGEVWQVLIKRGYSEARNGNYPFFKDLLDRYYGKAKELLDITTGGEKIQGINYIIPKNEPSRKDDNNSADL